MSPSTDADSNKRYSVWNPVPSTFLANKISPRVNPLALATDIVASFAVTFDPDIVVALVTHNCPPTAFTDSFSNVVVLNVPLILTFSNSAVPFPSDDIFHPLKPLAKSLVCKIPSGFIIKLPPSIEAVVIAQPPIDADTNLANPSALIDDDEFVSVDGDPPINAGVLILFAVTDPNIVTPSVIVPPSNNTLDAVICPPDFNRSSSSADFISSVFTTNPAIEADTNLANPWSDIDDDAFDSFAGDPPIVAGVKILLAETDPSIETLSVIVPPSIKILDAVISPVVCIWYPEEDISNSPFPPCINCEDESPRKNVWVLISKILGSVLYLKKLFESATNSSPTPLYVVSVCNGNADPENNKNPPPEPVAWLNPSYPNDLIYPVFLSPTISTPEFKESATVNDPVNIEKSPSIYLLPPSNGLFPIKLTVLLLEPNIL